MQRENSEEPDLSEAENGIKSEYRVRLNGILGLMTWTHVLAVYVPHIILAAMIALAIQVIHQYSIAGIQETIMGILDVLFVSLLTFSPAIRATIMVLVVGWVIVRMDNPVYLMSFATFKAPESWLCSHDDIMAIMANRETFTDESLTFMRRILSKSGTGQETAWPPGLTQGLTGPKSSIDTSMEKSREEAETVIFDIVEKALKAAHLRPKDIDFLVINCSLFSPTPSLCAMVINHFGMRSDCESFNLSGMGCSASLIAVSLAKRLLQTRKRPNMSFGHGGLALVVSTEIITPNLYQSNERKFLLQNTLFRCGGAAIVLSNRWLDGRRAWYKLLHTVRVQGTDKKSYECVFETEDASGERGVALSKDIVTVAGKCMEKNLTMLGPYVLPMSELTKVLSSVVARMICKSLNSGLSRHEHLLKLIPNVKVYVPDFKAAVDHFCIHAGGRAVIDGIEKNMKLEPHHTEPSRMALLNYGNTSSSSIWYELEYIQYHQKTNSLKKGDRILQVAFGSGFKCTSAVW
eukprot:CAMPEP_0116020440 /NCGR_PEP_ID=MMETSP0321-20121206/9796_1 /TAXON_ID=163516 /ORGANISM="Leptocylindrus danicus var. danicus, Strain B650" /LENGTH=518 /DNA_ID=CAMNT_0003491127 /DNA_START=47 /DNA_END=1600 /DNA_ORIENTATION=+